MAAQSGKIVNTELTESLPETVVKSVVMAWPTLNKASAESIMSSSKSKSFPVTLIVCG